MKINEMPVLQMWGMEHVKSTNALENVKPYENLASAAKDSIRIQEKSFGEYLTEAISAMNRHQIDVDAIGQKVITDPESVDIHDVTVAMAKASQSMTLAKTIIDRLVSGWNEITTTR